MKTKQEIITDIRKLIDACITTANDAGYYGGFDIDMLLVARVLLQGADRLTELANGVEVGQ